jgi:hypothetical protein
LAIFSPITPPHAKQYYEKGDCCHASIEMGAECPWTERSLMECKNKMYSTIVSLSSIYQQVQTGETEEEKITNLFNFI